MAPSWLLLPQRCAVCDVPGPALCERCDRLLVRLAPPLCERCGAPGAWPVRRCVECSGRRLSFATARAAIAYDARARTLVRAWKEHGRRDLAAVAAGIVTSVVPAPAVGGLVPVPGDAERTRGRGHVPAARLARELGRLWGLPQLDAMRRTRSVERQRGLTLAERRRNVRGAFVSVGVLPARVCLVDDVYTTGSTASACAQALRAGGAQQVEVVCLARALR
jgi:ComF family protein